MNEELQRGSLLSPPVLLSHLLLNLLKIIGSGPPPSPLFVCVLAAVGIVSIEQLLWLFMSRS